MRRRKNKSKKQSVVCSEPHKPLVFFIDRSLGKRVIANALRAADCTVEVHDDHFPPDAKDEVWLTEVGRRGWVVLSKDQNIRHNMIEKNAILGASVRAFILTAGGVQGKEMAEIFTKSLPVIVKFARKRAAPFIATITRGGMVRDYYP